MIPFPDIRSNAVDIIKWAGVEQQIRDASTKEAGMSFVNSDGRYVYDPIS